MPNESKLFGLVTRKARWHLSWLGWLMILFGLVAMAILWVVEVYPFLAVNKPTQTDVLVVEGWIHNYAVQTAVAEFKTGKYRAVYSTGGPVVGSAGYTNDFNTYASVCAELLVADGIPKELVQMVPSHEAGRDRTYTSAVVLKQWLDEHRLHPAAINLITEDAHARRSLLLFQKALGSDIKVGVIPIRNPDFDPDHWWRYSEGVREMIGETIAYVYAKFFFRPQ